MEWHRLEKEEVLKAVGSSLKGLDSASIPGLQLRYGMNQLAEKHKTPTWKMFLSQFGDFMVLVLIAAAVISGFIGAHTDAIIILIIVLLNAILGFVQEFRAEKAMAALRKMAAHQARVIRDGKLHIIPATALVPGDIVMLETGTSVPADLRLVESHMLRADESPLTGESVPVDKTTGSIEGDQMPVSDRLNIAYKGTTITHGRGLGVVVATGMQTELGRIAELLQESSDATPLQRRMSVFGRQLSYIILLICIILLGIGILRGEDPMKMILLSVSLAVAAIPEALPALITLALAFGARRMAKEKALIRKLPAVETLGSVSIICTDKTGTLTQNKMRVVGRKDCQKPMPSMAGYTMLDLAMSLNSDAISHDHGKWEGDATEIALVDFIESEKGSGTVTHLQRLLPRSDEKPFDSERKCMTTVHDFDGRHLVVTKGAAESIAQLLSHKEAAAAMEADAHRLASDGVRVLAFAYLFLEPGQMFQDEGQLTGQMEYAGMAWMIDPPRWDVTDAIVECKKAGIKVTMITGDHPATAAYIARQIGIVQDDGEKMMTGKELDQISDQAFEEIVEHVAVYSRVSPGQKLRIIRALRKKGHSVAMTGDGVNDAPSLKAADIGVAMGVSGTDVSKEASHMILLDDRFATIVAAVKEGRRIFDNIRRFVKYIMTCNVAEIWTIVLAPLMGLPIPLLPIHLLWINLVTDGLPGLALSAERAEKDVMFRPPRKQDESLFAGGLGFHIAWIGLLMSGVTLSAQAWTISNQVGHWQTMVFCILAFSQLGHVMAIRSDRQFLFRQGLFSNLPLLFAVVLTVILQLLVVYTDTGNWLFHTRPLQMKELLFCLAISAIPFHAVELEKFIRNLTSLKRRS